VNSGKEICESDYSTNAAAVKIALWSNGYGVAPYFTQKQAVNPFPSLYADLTPPRLRSGLDTRLRRARPRTEDPGRTREHRGADG
jgi:hypothetical protein